MAQTLKSEAQSEFRIPEVEVSQTILIGDTPNAKHWIAGLVEACGGQNITAYGVFNGMPQYNEALRHVNDPWWDRPNSMEIAAQEEIRAWKLSERDVRLDQLLAEFSEWKADKTNGTPPVKTKAKKPRPQPKATTEPEPAAV